MKVPEIVISEREMMRTGHHAWLIIAVSCVVFITDDIMGDRNHGPWQYQAAYYLTRMLTVLWFWALFCQFMIHDRHLCERCAAATPLNPQAAVERWKPALKMQHGKAMGVFFALLLLWIAVNLFLKPQPYWSYLVQAAFQFGILVLVVIGMKHSRLQAWCPWCHWDDGGGEEVSPDVPDPAISR